MKKIKTVEFSAGFFSPGPLLDLRVHITFKLLCDVKILLKNPDPVLILVPGVLDGLDLAADLLRGETVEPALPDDHEHGEERR